MNSKSKVVRFAVVGMGGFAQSHIHQIGEEERKGRARLAAVAEAFPDAHKAAIKELKSRGVRVYADALEMFEAEKGRADVVTLPVGISLHAPLSVAAMNVGYDVLVEKPAAATVQEVDAMIDASERTGRFCAVGFQFQSMDQVKKARNLVSMGVIGKIREISCVSLSSRRESYYRRNSWAGKAVGANGEWILDGPMVNALSHQLMLSLYLAGPGTGDAARPLEVTAELYRARDISGEDTDCVRARLEGGVSLFSLFTHATGVNSGASYWIRGDKGEITGNIFEALKVRADGREISLEHTPCGSVAHIVDYCLGEAKSLDCPVAAARNMTLLANCGYESSGRIHSVPGEHRESIRPEKCADDPVSAIRGVEHIAGECFEEGRTFSELGVPWAVGGSPFSPPDNYKFPMRFEAT